MAHAHISGRNRAPRLRAPWWFVVGLLAVPAAACDMEMDEVVWVDLVDIEASAKPK